jgi:hypothetical protein
LKRSDISRQFSEKLVVGELEKIVPQGAQQVTTLPSFFAARLPWVKSGLGKRPRRFNAAFMVLNSGR